MDCDGGSSTIPCRDELVRLKKKLEQKDKDAERTFKWRNCALSQQPLQEPVVACGLGRLYSKSSVTEALLDKETKPDSINHIKSLKDIKDLNLAKNPAFVNADLTEGNVGEGNAPYICPISGIEMSGKFRFVFLWSCGCVLSERALKEVRETLCHMCQQPFTDNDVVVLNGNEEDIELLKTKMAERVAERKASKHRKSLKKLLYLKWKLRRLEHQLRIAKRNQKQKEDAERTFKWRNCALSQQPLQEPVVACGLGRLYSKSSVTEALLDQETKPDSIDHIKSLKDIKDLNLAKNPAFVNADLTEGNIGEGNAPYICPISGIEMSGKFRFVFLWSCGCVLSERALKEVRESLCQMCQQPFTDNDVVVLNGNEEDIELLKTKMAERVAERKASKDRKSLTKLLYLKWKLRRLEHQLRMAKRNQKQVPATLKKRTRHYTLVPSKVQHQ